MSGVMATARLVRPAYRTPGRDVIPTYTEILEDDLGRALDEVEQLKEHLKKSQAALGSATAQVKRQREAIEQLQVEATTIPRLKQAIEHLQDAVAAGQKSGFATCHWKAGQVRAAVKFPLNMADRAGLAAVIRRPLRLRSGAVLDPVNLAVRLRGRVAVLPDSSWLALSVLARRPGEFVARIDLEIEVFGRDTGGSARSALHRARRTLESVGAEGDLETTRIDRRGNWRLLRSEAT